jgi:oxygen-independent coproporphyrinogen-3 oxidase
MPDDDTRAEQYELAEAVLASAGLRRYEVSNWARPGHESRHNLAYWTGVPYAAAGAGAHSFMHLPRFPGWLGEAPAGAVTVRQWNLASPAAYIASVRQHGHASGGQEWLDLATTASDLMMMGLRLREGLDLDAADRALPGVANAVRRPLGRLLSDGLLTRRGPRVMTTERGGELLNRVVAEFLP